MTGLNCPNLSPAAGEVICTRMYVYNMQERYLGQGARTSAMSQRFDKGLILYSLCVRVCSRQPALIFSDAGSTKRTGVRLCSVSSRRVGDGGDTRPVFWMCEVLRRHSILVPWERNASGQRRIKCAASPVLYEAEELLSVTLIVSRTWPWSAWKVFRFVTPVSSNFPFLPVQSFRADFPQK